MATVNLSDVELAVRPSSSSSMDIRETSDTANDDYIRPGTFVKMKDWETYASKVLSESYKSMGMGPTNMTVQNFLSKIDRHGTAMVPANTLNYGYTFITRPRLNMSEGNLRQHPVMASLINYDPNSIAFMIRMLLDTRLHRGESIRFAGGATAKSVSDRELNLIQNIVDQSSLLDQKSPFFIPLCNGLKGVSGWPDFMVTEETTEGDFHSGDFTFAKGSDFNNRSTELSLEFKDVQGSILLAIFYYWCLTMALQAKGTLMAYPDDIYLQRLNYTVSIYRFITDPARKHVLWWSKATGCFPKAVPLGALFNVNQGDVSISSANNFSIPFAVNDIKYNDPGIIMDFNRLVERYHPGIVKQVEAGDALPDNEVTGAIQSAYNFMARPYITGTREGKYRMSWFVDSEALKNNPSMNTVISSAENELTKTSISNMKEAFSTLGVDLDEEEYDV